MAKSIQVIPKQLIHEREQKPPDAHCADEEMTSTNQPSSNEWQVFLSLSLTLGQAACFAVPQFLPSPWEKSLGFFMEKCWGK